MGFSGKEVQVHKSSYFVMATAPTLARVFSETNKDLQDHPDNPVSSETRRQGRGGGTKWCRVHFMWWLVEKTDRCQQP